MKRFSNVCNRVRSASALMAWLAFEFCALSAGADSPATMPAERVHRVELGTIREIEMTRELRLTGSLEPLRDIEIGARARGRIVSIPIEEGQRVSKGDLIFEMDDRADKIAVARAQAELEKAQAQRGKMKTGSLPQEIIQARKALDAADARQKAAGEEWNRMRPLAEEQVISKSEATKARLAYEVAQAEFAQVQARVKLVEDGFRSEEVVIAEAEVRARQAALDDAKRLLEDHRVTAPESGAIVERVKEAGEWAAEGEQVARMVVLNPLKLRIEVPQAQIPLIKIGQKADLTVDGLEDRKFSAEVSNVIPQARNETRNFPVMLKVENADLKLAAGMFGRVRLEVGDTKSALAIPREAIQYRGAKMVIYRAERLVGKKEISDPATPSPDSIAREIEIEIVEEREQLVIIRSVGGSNIEAGMEIVVIGGSKLKNGSPLLRLNSALSKEG